MYASKTRKEKFSGPGENYQRSVTCRMNYAEAKPTCPDNRAALTGKHDTLVRRAPCQPGTLLEVGIHLTRLSTEGLGPRHGEVRRAHQMLNAAVPATSANLMWTNYI